MGGRGGGEGGVSGSARGSHMHSFNDTKVSEVKERLHCLLTRLNDTNATNTSLCSTLAVAPPAPTYVYILNQRLSVRI